jgi:hypothetical protein
MKKNSIETYVKFDIVKRKGTHVEPIHDYPGYSGLRWN